MPSPMPGTYWDLGKCVKFACRQRKKPKKYKKRKGERARARGIALVDFNFGILQLDRHPQLDADAPGLTL